jgi:hypothetical protein
MVSLKLQRHIAGSLSNFSLQGYLLSKRPPSEETKEKS